MSLGLLPGLESPLLGAGVLPPGAPHDCPLAHRVVARFQWRVGEPGDPARLVEEFLTAHELLTEAGFEHYEVSNFGRPGKQSRHNAGYWSGSSYVGLGPAAHGYDGSVRRWNEREYSTWASRANAGLDPVGGSETLTAENRISEEVYLGLRTVRGLALRGDEIATVSPWVDAGWAIVDAGILRLSPEGWLRLDALAASLTMLRSH